MQIILKLILFALIALDSAITIVDKKFEYFKSYKSHLYTIHPLVVIVKGQDKVLVHQDILMNNGMVKNLSDASEQFVLYCSGYNNLMSMTYKDRVNIDTDYYPKYWVSKYGLSNPNCLKVKLKQLRCLSPVLATFELPKPPNSTCALNDRGNVIDIGFKVDRFLKLYTVCFDQKENLSAIYTSHQLFGSILLFPENLSFSKVPYRRFVKHMLSIDDRTAPYLLENQKKTFIAALGKKQGNLIITSCKGYYGRIFISAPLVPPGDFYYPPFKTATHAFENTLPIFTTIFNRDWQFIQTLGRMLAFLAASPSKKLEVITGWLDMLTLSDDDGNQKPIYLDFVINGKEYRPIPKFLYKIYYDEELKKGIAFVTMNNPFSRNKIDDFPCHHIGKDFINIDYFAIGSDETIRNTVYCKVDDLMRTVKDIPSMDLTNGHLYLDVDDLNLPRHHLPPDFRKNRKS